MKRLLLAVLLLAASLEATIVTGRVTDLVGQTTGANRKLTFELMNCPTGSVRVIGATWDISTAVPLVSDPTAFLTYTGYPYQLRMSKCAYVRTCRR